jgi:L-prolyl-PCP dehydrogenase
MDFAWTPEQLELRDALVAFCRGRLDDRDLERRDRDGEFARAAWQLLGEQGLLGASVDEAHGGAGLDALTGVLLMEALGYACPDLGLAFSVAAHVYACVKPIEHFGTDEQRRRWLLPLVSGDAIAAHAITEPEAGSDIFAMRTRAVRRGDDYVLDGSKCFVTNAPVADLLLVHAVTDPGLGFFGLSAFLVERDRPGVAVSPAHDKIGLRTSPLGDIFLENVVVPASNRLGDHGAGAPVFTFSMAWERTCLFAIYVGAMARQLEETIGYARERTQFRQRIGKFQAVGHRLVDMKVRLEAARLLLHRSAWKLARGEDDPVDAGIAKLFISEAAVQSGLDAIQVHGGLGVMSGRVERYLRDAVPARVFSGTSEIQRNNIARALGL